ncbi:hypothetical protein AAGG74_16670 [Bacillus mexicanus]|uniref:hypothetical protein n=1 Tax=Bacillus mexicanus TaxID=2834415 RepID=UPI003D1AD81D
MKQDITVLIRELRSEYIKNGLANNYEEINCGLCNDFAEEIEYRFNGTVEILSNDHFVEEREGLDGWNGDEQDKWVKKWLKVYDSMPPYPLTVEKLTDEIRGYHCWVYSDGLHYDAECPEGVKNMFDLPFFQRYLACEQ